MIKKTKRLGKSTTGYPYEVSLVLDPDSNKIIELAEGSGMVSSAGHFPLVDLLKPTWEAHLDVCGVLWLREMAVLQPAPTVEDILAEYERRLDAPED